MSVRIGVSPIAWSNDDLTSLGGETSLETCLTEARAAGFEGVELGTKFPRDAATLSPILAAHGLDLVSGWYSTDLLNRTVDQELAAMEDHAALLSALGCSVVIVAEATNTVHGDRSRALSTRPVLSVDEMSRLTSRLTELADRLLDRGLRVAYHHHVGTVIETGDEITALMEGTGPAVGFLIDTGHALFGGGDPAALARTYADRIVHIHCKDIRPDVMERVRAQDLSFLDAVIAGVFTVPGDGCIDYAPVLATAADAGYSGWLVIEAEQDPAVANPATYARLGFDTLSRAAREAGLI